MKNTKNDTTCFSSASDIRRYLQMCIERQEEIEEELKGISIKKFKFRNNEERCYKRQLRQQLKRIKGYIQYHSGLLEKYATVHTDTMMEFLVDYLSMKEGEPYELLTGIIGDGILIPTYTDEYTNLSMILPEFNLILSKSNKEKVENLGCKYIDDVIKVCDDQKYIMVEYGMETSFLSGMELCGAFQQYPYLKEVADQLVDYKFSEPSISDSECFRRIMMKKENVKKMSHMAGGIYF